MIQLKHVKKVYGQEEIKQVILSDLSLHIRKGSMTAVMGPSGSGKSTLLNIIGIMDTKYEGTYLLDGQDVSRMTEVQKAAVRNEKIGFIFQDFNLISELSALENVKLMLLFSNINRPGKERYRTSEIERMCE